MADVATVTVHLAGVKPVARIIAKIMTADRLAATLTVPEVAALPPSAAEAVALLQEAAADIEALGVVTAGPG